MIGGVAAKVVSAGNWTPESTLPNCPGVVMTFLWAKGGQAAE
jgi:hypothetical protein